MTAIIGSFVGKHVAPRGYHGQFRNAVIAMDLGLTLGQAYGECFLLTRLMYEDQQGIVRATTPLAFEALLFHFRTGSSSDRFGSELERWVQELLRATLSPDIASAKGKAIERAFVHAMEKQRRLGPVSVARFSFDQKKGQFLILPGHELLAKDIDVSRFSGFDLPPDVASRTAKTKDGGQAKCCLWVPYAANYPDVDAYLWVPQMKKASIPGHLWAFQVTVSPLAEHSTQFFIRKPPRQVRRFMCQVVNTAQYRRSAAEDRGQRQEERHDEAVGGDADDDDEQVCAALMSPCFRLTLASLRPSLFQQWKEALPAGSAINFAWVGCDSKMTVGLYKKGDGQPQWLLPFGRLLDLIPAFNDMKPQEWRTFDVLYAK
jgi:hypothetical protein